jgi:hypothetical protein
MKEFFAVTTQPIDFDKIQAKSMSYKTVFAQTYIVNHYVGVYAIPRHGNML